MTCDHSEFVTNTYENTANVAKFERLTNISIRKHIRWHILHSVRVASAQQNYAYQKKVTSQTTMSFVQFVTGILPFLLSRKLLSINFC